MMKAIGTLVHSTTSRRVGNHAVMVGDECITCRVARLLHLMEGTTRYFTYHENSICMVDDKCKRVKFDWCGYDKSPSTTRVINDYKRYFVDELGYQIVEEA